MARTTSRTRLDQPKGRTRPLRHAHDPERFVRWSDKAARSVGSARAFRWLGLFVLGWVMWNALAPSRWRFDPFPFHLLTLLLALMACCTALLVLAVHNRKADRDRVQFKEDRSLTDRLMADTEYLTREIASVRIATGELATRDYLRGELRALLDDLDGRLQRASGEGSPEVGDAP